MSLFKNSKHAIAAKILLLIFVVVAAYVIPAHSAHAFLGVDIYSGLIIYANELLLGLANAILSTGALILGVAGVLLEAVLKYTVLEMATTLSPQGALGEVIATSWKAFRDVANMMFIFILLYVAIGTILDIGVDMKKTLRNVIIVAILLNFSLFFTKTILDVSNILTINFYNKIAQESQVEATSIAGRYGSGISNAFMTKFGLTTLYNPETSKSVLAAENGQSGGQMMKLALLGFVFMLVAAFVFFAMAILFIQRFVTIIFLLILSPLAFAAVALPKDKYSSKWWDKLWDQIIFGPVCFALMWVTLQILGGITKAKPAVGSLASVVSGTAAGGASNVASIGQTVMSFAIAIAFMVGVLIVAKQTGAEGAGGLMKMGKKWRQTAQGYVGRGAVRVGLGTLQGAAKITRADKVFTEEFGKTKIGRGLKSVTTGALRDMDFGSGQSVSKVDKEVKKRNEDYVKEVEKGLEKTLDKSLPEKRKARVAEIETRMPVLDTELKKADEERARLETQLRTAGTSGLAIPAAQVQESERKISELKTKSESLRKERAKIDGEKTGLEERIQNNTVATKDEKQMWLRPMQKEKAEALDPKNKPDNRIGKIGRAIADFTRPAEKKMAAKKLRENARGGGGKDVKATLQELLDESGEAPKKPEGGGGGEKKE